MRSLSLLLLVACTAGPSEDSSDVTDTGADADADADTDVDIDPTSQFSSTPTSWSLPAINGDQSYGLYDLSDLNTGVGSDTWSTLDLTGDGRPDLVHTLADGVLPGSQAWHVYEGRP